MEFIFTWCDSLSQPISWKEDEHIISLEIFQKEFSFASANISIVASDKKMRHYARVGLKKDGRIFPIFSGRVTSFPIGFRSNAVQIEMIAEPYDFHRQLMDFRMNSSKQDLHILQQNPIILDDLFYSDEDLKNPTVLLEGSNNIFYWNPSSEKLSLSHINRGSRQLEISPDQILQNSVKVRLAREPYSSISISLSANWIRYQHVAIDIFPWIAQQFQNKHVNSFTDIKANFTKIASSAYCNIREINPNTLGTITNYPTKSCDFSINYGKQKCSFKRFYYDGNIIFNLDYSHQMRETVHFKIKRNTKNIHTKHLNIELKNIQLPKKYQHWKSYVYYCESDFVLENGYTWKCTKSHQSTKEFETEYWEKQSKIPDALSCDSCTSFFATPRGQNSIKYAAQKALALLNYSQRYIEIEFSVQIKDFFDVSLDDEITLKNISNYCEEIHGKVIKKQLVATTKHSFIKVTIGCGKLLDMNVLNNWIPKIDITPMTSNDIVQSVEIINPPEQQIAALKKIDGHPLSELKQTLQKMTTKIKVIMKPENKVSLINRDINLPDITVG